MKQLGKVSGKIYEDDFRTEILFYQECCSVIKDEQAQDKEFIKQQRKKNWEECQNCLACPLAEERYAENW